MEYHYPRIYAAIDLSAVEENVRQIKAHLSSGVKIIPVVKMDGYGHGAVEIAELLEEEEAVWGYAVATVEEACELRRSGRKKPVLVLGAVFPGQWETMLEYHIQATVFEEQTAVRMSELAVKKNTVFPIHIKIDTGMNRIGIRAEEQALETIRKITSLPGIKTEGVYTHFARADETDKTSAHKQAKRFLEVVEQIKTELGQDLLVHCANSAAIMDLPQYHMDAVRAGIILYGLRPSDQVNTKDFLLSPVLSLKSTVTYVKELKKGDEVSYGGTFRADRPMRIATIPVGYGDGYPRSLSNKGYVLIDGKRAPVCGRICMDQFMVDVSRIPSAEAGSEVTLIGKENGAQITVEELSELCGRFNYEFVCNLGKRIPRVFFSQGAAVNKRDYF